jgi:hypothetical protein
MVTRAENISSSINEVAYLVAHGDATRSTFKVPSNVTIAFFSKPGYYLMDDIYRSHKFQELLRSKNKSLAFIQGNKSVFPETLIRRNWNWRNHVYPTGTDCPDLYIEIYDHDPTKPHMDAATGLYVAGYQDGKFLHGERGHLSDVAKFISDKSVNKSKQWMLFVNACRGFPGLSTVGLTPQQLENQSYYVNNRNSPLRTIINREASTSRITQKKRKLNTPPSGPEYMTGITYTTRTRIAKRPRPRNSSSVDATRNRRV